MSNIQSIVDDFANQLSALIEAQVVERARATVAAALGAQGKRGPGRPPKLAKLVELAVPAGVGGRPQEAAQEGAAAALPGARLQEPRGAHLRHGLLGPQERLQDEDQGSTARRAAPRRTARPARSAGPQGREKVTPRFSAPAGGGARRLAKAAPSL